MSSYQNLDVLMLDKVTKYPVAGVLVRVLSEDGAVVYTEGVTNDEGTASFMLWTQRYTLRFYKFQVRFSQPLIVDVLEGQYGAPVQNSFLAYGEAMSPPMANDTHLCRASGYFRDITGAAHKYLDIFFIGEFGPILLDGSAVLSERRAIKTDEKGYACVDLIRCANYAATVEGYEDQVRRISVPDAPSVSLPALLFPTVESVSFDSPSPWTLSVGSEVSIKPTVVTSSKIPTAGPDCINVVWSLEDPTVASITLLQDSIVLRGLKPGTTKLLASRRDQSIVSVPYVKNLIGSGQQVTVTA